MENRKQKGKELFLSKGIKRVDKNKWKAESSRKGSEGQKRFYFVKKLDKYTWSCTCEDHLYRFEQCYHIEAAKLDEIHNRKEGFKKHEKFFNNKLRNLKIKKRAINEHINKLLKQNKEHMKLHGTKSEDLKKEAKRQHYRLLEVEAELKKFQTPRTLIVG